MNTEDDFEKCEYWIDKLLSNKQKSIINCPYPFWELNPPQREEYLTPYSYALGMKDYADRVINFKGK
jgi:hypothetical protein